MVLLFKVKPGYSDGPIVQPHPLRGTGELVCIAWLWWYGHSPDNISCLLDRIGILSSPLSCEGPRTRHSAGCNAKDEGRFMVQPPKVVQGLDRLRRVHIVCLCGV